MPWTILLFFLVYPWKYTTVNLPWEMAVTHDLRVSQGKEPFYRGKRKMCNRLSIDINARGGGTRYIPGWGGAARPFVP